MVCFLPVRFDVYLTFRALALRRSRLCIPETLCEKFLFFKSDSRVNVANSGSGVRTGSLRCISDSGYSRSPL